MLHAAAKNGNIESIKLLLSQGFDIDSRDREGITPLMHTALNGQQGVFQMLIKNGADPFLKTSMGSVCSTLLHKVEIHPLSRNCYHLVFTLIQQTMMDALH